MDDQPPLIWPQFESSGYTRRRSPSIFGPAIIRVISAAMFLVFVTMVMPRIVFITSQIVQPASVKRGWDSINIVLVVFAILCGVLAKRNDGGLSQSSHGGKEEEEVAVTSGELTVGEDTKISSSSEFSSEQWFDDMYDADRLNIYENLSNLSFPPGLLPINSNVPLRRSSTSYPDLRNGVLKEKGDRRFRFYDDFEIDKYQSHDLRSYQLFPIISKVKIEEEIEPKEILVDKLVLRPSSPPPPAQQRPASPTPPPPPPVEISHKLRRIHRSVRNRDMQENTKRNTDSTKFKRVFVPPPSPPPPPPLPSRPLITATPPRKQDTLQRRKSNAAKEIKMAFVSLYNQGKKKKNKKLQKLKRKESIESPAVVVMDPPQHHSLIPPPSPPPPPPPLPPPPRSSQSVFYGLYKKGVRSNKKIHSIPAPPPPPPPRRKIQLVPQTPPRRMKFGRPPRPTKLTNFNEENNVQGSPLINITPPPPPPPPFRVSPLKFVVSGDFAKIQSNQSSRCSSPVREVVDLGWGLELTQFDEEIETTITVGPGFCPSPDVNTKADNFIARLRDEWRFDKINSVNRKRLSEPYTIS